jgi:hypothetical protein
LPGPVHAALGLYDGEQWMTTRERLNRQKRLIYIRLTLGGFITLIGFGILIAAETWWWLSAIIVGLGAWVVSHAIYLMPLKIKCTECHRPFPYGTIYSGSFLKIDREIEHCPRCRSLIDQAEQQKK